MRWICPGCGTYNLGASCVSCRYDFWRSLPPFDLYEHALKMIAEGDDHPRTTAQRALDNIAARFPSGS